MPAIPAPNIEKPTKADTIKSGSKSALRRIAFHSCTIQTMKIKRPLNAKIILFSIDLLALVEDNFYTILVARVEPPRKLTFDGLAFYRNFTVIFWYAL